MMLYTIGFILPINNVHIDAGLVKDLTELKDIVYTLIANEMYNRTYDGPFENYEDYTKSLSFNDSPIEIHPIIVSYKNDLNSIVWNQFIIDNEELMVYYYELFGQDSDEEELDAEDLDEEDLDEEDSDEEDSDEEDLDEYDIRGIGI